VSAEISSVLLPREYTIDLGVHHQNGRTADYVQRTFDFTVLCVAGEGADHYQWGRTRGFVMARVTWWCPSCVARSQISRENAGLGALVFTQFSQRFSGAQ